jgi:hypothetical protein
MIVCKIKQNPIDPEKKNFFYFLVKIQKKKKPQKVTRIEEIDVYVLGWNLYNPMEEKRAMEKNLRNCCEKRKRR